MNQQTVVSQDGTQIAYYVSGSGPGIVIISGNNRMAHNYEKLAGQLSSRYTVYIMERRGRGQSGPQGSDYSLQKEIDDAQAVLAATGSSMIFGHSYGGLIALHAARHNPAIKKLIVYEPTVSIQGSFDLTWLPQFEQAFHANRPVKATVLFLQRAKLSAVSEWPKPLLYILAILLLQGKSGKEMRELMPTTPAEIRETQRADSEGVCYADIMADTLLLAGENGARPVIKILPTLRKIIPRASYTVLPKLNHNSPDLGPVDTIVATTMEHIEKA